MRVLAIHLKDEIQAMKDEVVDAIKELSATIKELSATQKNKEGAISYREKQSITFSIYQGL